MKYGVLQLKGSWTQYDEGNEFTFRAQSLDKAYEHIRKSPELYDHLRARCFQESGLLYRHR